VTGALVSAGVAWLVARWRPFRVEVQGNSMEPTLLPGDWALAVAPGRPRRGQVVVVEHPGRPGFEVVKRITAVPGDLRPDGEILGPDEYWVEGDNLEASTDSRRFGAVPGRLLRARLYLVLWPGSRRGVIHG
jgi:inner membrane protease subunit 1